MTVHTRTSRTRSDTIASDRVQPRRFRRASGLVEALEQRTLLSVSILNSGGNGYAGLSFNQSGGYTPPDTCGAAGPSVYVETVNQTVAIYNPKATGASATTASLSTFWFTTGGLTRASSSSGLSDPIVTYDEQIGRFIVGDQDVDFTNHVSAFDLAVSKTNTPTAFNTTNWAFYKITTTETGFDADYPGNFGYNHDAFVFTLNMFSTTGGAGHVQIVSVKASDLQSAAASPLIAANDLANRFSLRPTTMHDSVAGDPMWFVTEHGDDHSIDVIKMTNELTTTPTFTATNLAVTAYSPVVNPLNPNGTEVTGNIDSRIMKAAEYNNTIVAAHAVSASSTQDVAQWYAISVSTGTPTLLQQGRVSAGANTYVIYPGIDINQYGQIGMSYMKSGTDTTTDFLSMYVTGRAPTDSTGTMETGVLVPAGTGQANYTDFANPHRAGDLSGINLDPTDGSFWAANEFANTQATANWGTAIADFIPTPVLASVVVNGDDPHGLNDTLGGSGTSATQRSMVDDIVYTFSSAVTLGTGAFTIAVHSGLSGMVPTLAWAPEGGGTGPATQWVVTFTGSTVMGSSIANGVYDITLNAGAYASGSAARTDTFYRLFGDINGDHFVNAGDNLRFRTALTTYNVDFDFNLDGFVNAGDNLQFRASLMLGSLGTYTTTI